jgi:hypothetical protein
MIKKGMCMKKIIILLAFWLIQQATQAQGILYLSNLGQTPTGNNPVGDHWQVASEVFTGNNANGYLLDAVELEMADASGTPNGFTVMLYSAHSNVPTAGGFSPGSSLGTLTGSDNPSTAGIYSYSPVSSLTLSPNTYYFIVLTAGTSVENETYEWSVTDPNSYNPTDNWGAGGVWFTRSPTGSGWSYNSSDAPEFALTATAIPEPSALSLLLLGGGVFLYVRTRKQRAA